MRKILIIDDEPDILKTLVYTIKKLGQDVYTADTGEKGLKLIRDEKPDVVLLDLRLPDVDGMKICSSVKSDAGLQDMKIILISASAEGIEEKLEKCGADVYVLKPFDPADVLQIVKKLLNL